MNITDEDVTFIEPILRPDHFRFTLYPINPKFKSLWDLYLLQEASFWRANEVDLSKDLNDYNTLNEEEKHFINMVIAFFAASDGIVNFNLAENFSREIQVLEARVCYDYQKAMENIHSRVYSEMLFNIIKDKSQQDRMINAITEIPVIKAMADWALQWVHSDAGIAQRLIAFAIVEGIFFSGAFASIFWLKSIRSNGKDFMMGLVKSNEFIARDEGMHVNFACLLYDFIERRVPVEIVEAMFREAVTISQNFTLDAIRCDMIGMNQQHMNTYIEYVADRLLVYLNYQKIYNVKNPFDFMNSIGFLNKANFFENRSTGYQKSHTEKNNASWVFPNIYDDDAEF
jgi:ribonucleoside-diphosphate reductase subunit M2